jgi:hypothetical protein
MSATNNAATVPSIRLFQRGSTAVEFGVVLLPFLIFIFVIIELGRIMFLFNTLEDATRRAAISAAATDLGQAASLDTIRQKAIFRSSPGGLVLMPELTDQAIRIDYLSLARANDGALSMKSIAATSLPMNALENRRNCAVDPYAANCVRFVRVRVCNPQNVNGCDPMMFRTLTSIVPFSIQLPLATSVAQAQTMGL